MKIYLRPIYYNNFTNLFLNELKWLKIHQNIKYLTLLDTFDQLIEESIPNSVKHLTFGIVSINQLKVIYQ